MIVKLNYKVYRQIAATIYYYCILFIFRKYIVTFIFYKYLKFVFLQNVSNLKFKKQVNGSQQ